MTTATEKVLTAAERLQEVEERREALEVELAELREELASADDEYATLVADGAGNSSRAQELEGERSRLRDRIEGHEDALEIVEQRVEDARRAADAEELEQAIQRAEKLSERAAEAGEELWPAVEELVTVYRAFAEREAEAETALDKASRTHKRVEDSYSAGVEGPRTRLGADRSGRRKNVLSIVARLAEAWEKEA